MAKKNTIILIHGRGLKPPKADMEALWKDSLFFALKRDHPSKLKLLENAYWEFVYYGNYSNALMNGSQDVEPRASISSHRDTLERLVRYRANEFTIDNYRMLPGYPPRPESVLHGIGAIAQKLKLGRRFVELAAKDIREYWDDDVRFGKKVRSKLLDPLKLAMDRKSRIMVISHSLGAMIAYDVFWMLSRHESYAGTKYAGGQIDMWITMGSPLAEETAQHALMGSECCGLDRFPTNVKNWLNLCAEDDPICGKRPVFDQYKQMIEHGYTQSIEDRHIINLAVANGQVAPHRACGYLVHPELSHAVSAWL